MKLKNNRNCEALTPKTLLLLLLLQLNFGEHPTIEHATIALCPEDLTCQDETHMQVVTGI